MTENDKKIIKELIVKYGSEKILKFIHQEKQDSQKLQLLILEYLFSTNIDPATKKYVNPCVSFADENTQYLSNGISSIFQLKEHVIEKNWLIEERKIITKPILFEHQKNLDSKHKIENLVKDNCYDVSMIELTEMVYWSDLFSIVELNLIKQLLENPKIYMSRKDPAIIVESEKGSAYILGKDRKGQRTF